MPPDRPRAPPVLSLISATPDGRLSSRPGKGRTAAGYASSGRPSSLAGTRSPAGTGSTASPGRGSSAEGIEAGRPVPGRPAVQRWVHDLASWQYQRMSAQACPPSGTISSGGSTMPHSAHWVDCAGRGWCLRCLAIGPPQAREMPVHRNSATSSGTTPAGRTAVSDGAYAAIVPPREQSHQGPRRCADSLL